MGLDIGSKTALAALALALSAMPSQSSPWLFLSAPGATTMIASGINGHSEVVGIAPTTGNPSIRGFLRLPDGTTTLFDAPDATQTWAYGVDLAGNIAGHYTDSTGQHGFIRDPSGAMLTVDVPSHVGTQILAMSPKGAVAGQAVNSDLSTVDGFVRATNGTLAVFAVPGAHLTVPAAVNGKGAVAGIYVGADQVQHGFLRDRHGTLTPFDVPGAFDTSVNGMNDKGQIVGSYHPSKSSGTLGFVRQPDGSFTTVDVSTIVPAQSTALSSIDYDGDIAGLYIDPNGGFHGYVRDTNGSVTLLDAPGADLTIVQAISPNGKLIGQTNIGAFRLNKKAWKSVVN